MTILTIYIIGIAIALIQLLFLASYFDRKGASLEQLSASTIVCIASWFTVLLLCISYRKQFIEIFKKNDNT